MSNLYYVYILASTRKGTLYTGVTNNIKSRTYQHRENLVDGFTKEYGVHRLVYYEETPDITTAITREKQLKKWKREWKINLVEKDNPEWKDLYDDLI